MNRMIFHHDDQRGSGYRPMMSRPISVTAEDEEEFRVALEHYKSQSGRQFPTWSEILEILRSIGYAKRVWKPVEGWSALPAKSSSEMSRNEGHPDLAGWYATVETPI